MNLLFDMVGRWPYNPAHTEADAQRWGELTEWEERALELTGPALTRLYWTTIVVTVAAALWFGRNWIGAVWAAI